MEQMRSEGRTAALFLSPSKIQRARDIEHKKQQQKEQLQQEKHDKAVERASEKACKKVEATQKRKARATALVAKKAATEQRKAAAQEAREAKKRQKEAQQHQITSSEAISTRLTTVPYKEPQVPVVVTPSQEPTAHSARSRSRRIIQPPARLRE